MCSYIAATVPIEEGKENPLLTAASEITLGPDTELATDGGPSPAKTAISATTETPPGAATDPSVGSYERFLATFGRAMSG